MTQLFLDRPVNPKECRICRERFSEPWMAERCQAQGPPHIEYHALDVVINKAGLLLVCSWYSIHHRIGFVCDVQGPCPHDISYYGYELVPAWFGPERAFIGSVGPRVLSPGWEKLTTLTQKWGVIPESGAPTLYLAQVAPQVEWGELWSHYPEKHGRRGGRRML